MKSNFTASWVNNLPAFWVEGKRVSRAEGYAYAKKHNIDLPEAFKKWFGED